jgi:predicted ATP-grasp superfamily ATP-dependent carboligase
LLGVTRQLTEARWTNAPGFAYQGSIGPVALPSEIEHRLALLGNVLVERFELRGWLGVDFVIDDEGQLWILEINPRYTASIELLDASFGHNSAGDHIAACLGQEFAAVDLTSWRSFAGKAIMYARRSLTIDEQACGMLHGASGQFADLPAAPTVILKGAPVFSVLANGQSMAEALYELQSAGVAMLKRLEHQPST